MVSPSTGNAWLLAYVIIRPGPVGAQVLLADGSDRQCNWCHHDACAALPVPPQAALGPSGCQGAPAGHVHPEPWSRLQPVGPGVLSQEARGGTVGWVGGWM